MTSLFRKKNLMPIFYENKTVWCGCFYILDNPAHTKSPPKGDISTMAELIQIKQINTGIMPALVVN